MVNKNRIIILKWNLFKWNCWIEKTAVFNWNFNNAE